MYKRIIISIIIVGLCYSQSTATIWRVNNNPGISANFTNFTAAQSAATPNDSLYFEGSTVSYGNITITKPLVIIGPGYFLSENPETQVNLATAKFGNVVFNTGCSGTIISGLEVTGYITIGESNITIKRNYTKSIYFNCTTSYENIMIAQNYIYGGIENNTGTSLVNNIIISNNYTRFSGSYNNNAINLATNFSGTIINNVFDCAYSLNVHNFLIMNNLLTTGTNNTLVPTDNTFFNNICNHTQFPLVNGNQQNVSMTDVFMGATGNSTDGQWRLKTGSPAIGAGNDGSDCGMFGGVTPYVLSGLPEIPAIYYLNMPASGSSTNGINVTIKAKTH
ncbi:MAG: hypothetical protein HXX13_16110 [Bacteroidetes bacterium]|nr:hypothetical protein [Bacteroidota bacterium]